MELKSDNEYLDEWHNKSSTEKMDYLNLIDEKIKHYTELGLTVSQFRSGTFVYKDGIEIYASKENIVHFMKFIDVTDKWLSENKI